MSLIDLDLRPDVSRLASFGRFAAAAFGLLAALAWWRHSVLGVRLSPDGARAAVWVLAGLGAACLALSWVAPRALRGLWVALSVVAFPIGWVVSHAVLAFLYFGILTPIGVVFRAAGRDVLARRYDRSAPTYWIRRPPPPEPRRYYRQF